jgi:hypothetical protein
MVISMVRLRGIDDAVATARSVEGGVLVEWSLDMPLFANEREPASAEGPGSRSGSRYV